MVVRTRSTIRWGSIAFPKLKNAKPQTIEFPSVPDVKANARPTKLKARATSGLPVHDEVDYGPIVIDTGHKP